MIYYTSNFTLTNTDDTIFLFICIILYYITTHENHTRKQITSLLCGLISFNIPFYCIVLYTPKNNWTLFHFTLIKEYNSKRVLRNFTCITQLQLDTKSLKVLLKWIYCNGILYFRLKNREKIRLAELFRCLDQITIILVLLLLAFVLWEYCWSCWKPWINGNGMRFSYFFGSSYI